MPESFKQAVEKRLEKPKKETRYGYPIVRSSDEGLDEFFKNNSHVAGMAIGGGENGIEGERRIVFNPYVRNIDGSEFSEKQREGLYRVEAMRHLGGEEASAGNKVEFKITPEMQKWRESKFKPNEPYYSNDQAFKESVISRLIVGDDAPPVTEEVQKVVEKYNNLLQKKELPITPESFQQAVERRTNYGKRPDGTNKGSGWLGELKLPDGSVATEYSTQSDAVKMNGERVDFPTLVPTLSKEDVDMMVNDIIPNKKEIPEHIMQQAILFARDRISKGQSPFK